MNQILQDLGLSNNAAVVYLTLLETGRATVARIQDKAGLHSQIIYNAIDELMRFDLASFTTERGRRYFQAAAPSVLLQIQQERLSKLETALPELLTSFQKHEQQIVFVYSGNGDFQKARQTVLRSIPRGGTYYVIGNGGKRFRQALEGGYREQELARIARGVHKRIVDFKDIYAELGAPSGELEQLTSYRYLPTTEGGPASTLFGGDYLRLNLWTEPVLTILIKNKTLVESYKRYFEVLWQQAITPPSHL